MISLHGMTKKISFRNHYIIVELQKREDGEVSCSGTCMGEPPPDPQVGDHCNGPWQRIEAVEEAGRSNPHRPLTSNDMYPCAWL